MNRIFPIALATFALASATAYAGEGNGDPFALHMRQPIVAQQIIRDVGNETVPMLGRPIAVVQPGGLLPSLANNAPVQTANSLPAAAAAGTPGVLYAESVRRYAARREPTNSIFAGPRG